MTALQFCLKFNKQCHRNTHQFDRNKLSVHGTGVLVVVVKGSELRGYIFKDLKCFIHRSGLFVQDEIRVNL